MTFTFDSNMMHQQMNNMAVNQEVSRICAEHIGCEGCPLKNGNMNIQGVTVICETGRMKGESR